MKGPKKDSFGNPHIRRLTGEVPATILGFGAVIGCFIGYNTYGKQLKEYTNSFVVGVIKAAIMVILGSSYQAVAKNLASWENHKFNEGWESSLSTKNFAF